MDGTSTRILLATAGAGAVPEIGDFFEGGYVAGFITYTSGDPTHGLIYAPKGSYESSKQWKTTNSATSGTSSTVDGAANTANMADSSHPAANYCAGLTIDGKSDWYLPAYDELVEAYSNLNRNVAPISEFQSGGSEEFTSSYYWSSTEDSSSTIKAKLYHMRHGITDSFKKANSFPVRPMRRFAL